MSSLDVLAPSYQATNPYQIPSIGPTAEMEPENTPIVQPASTTIFSQEVNQPARPKAGGLENLLMGLAENYGETPGVTAQCNKNSGGKVDISEVSESSQAAVQNVAYPASYASTIGNTLTESKSGQNLVNTAARVGRSPDKAANAVQNIERVNGGLAKVGEAGVLVATPLSVANSAKTLTDKDSSVTDKISAGTTIAYDAAAIAKTAGGGSSAATASSISAVAKAQQGLAAHAPKAVGTLAKVGKAAPVIGSVASVFTGALDVKEGLTGGEIDVAKVTSGGLSIAAGVAMVIPGGQPVAAALALTSIAIDNREAIGKGAKAVGKGTVVAAKAVGKGTAVAAKAVGKGTATAAKAVGSGTATAAKAVGKGTATAAKAVGSGTATAAKAVGKGTATAAKAVGKGTATAAKAVGSGVAKGASKTAETVASGAKKVGGAAKKVGGAAKKVGGFVKKLF